MVSLVWLCPHHENAQASWSMALWASINKYEGQGPRDMKSQGTGTGMARETHGLPASGGSWELEARLFLLFKSWHVNA